MIYYVAMPFLPADLGLSPGQAEECPSPTSAIRRAEAMAHREPNVGAIAFSRSGDPYLGEFQDAVILKTFGEVPDDFGFG